MAKDVDLFKTAMAGVTPIKGRRSLVVREAKRKPKAAAPAPTRPPFAAPAGTTKYPAPQLFDRDIDRALARGKRSPEGKLDLHGMTLAAA